MDVSTCFNSSLAMTSKCFFSLPFVGMIPCIRSLPAHFNWTTCLSMAIASTPFMILPQVRDEAKMTFLTATESFNLIASAQGHAAIDPLPLSVWQFLAVLASDQDPILPMIAMFLMMEGMSSISSADCIRKRLCNNRQHRFPVRASLTRLVTAIHDFAQQSAPTDPSGIEDEKATDNPWARACGKIKQTVDAEVSREASFLRKRRIKT